MIVVDANVILAVIIPSITAAEVDLVRQADNEWIAPPLWRSEVRNVLGGYIRRSGMLVEEACELFESAADLISFDASASDVRICELVQTSTCTAYDLEFVVVAEELSLKLITLDKQILREFPAIAFTPQQFLAR